MTEPSRASSTTLTLSHRVGAIATSLIVVLAIVGEAIVLWPHRVAGVSITAFRVLVPIVAALAFVGGVNRESRSRLPRRPVAWVFGFYVLWAIMAVVLFVFVGRHNASAVMRLMGVAYHLLIAYALIRLVDSRERVRLVVKTAAVVYVVIVVLGLIEIVTGLHVGKTSLSTATTLQYLFTPSVWMNASISPAVGPFYNRNDVAAFLAIGLPLILPHRSDSTGRVIGKTLVLMGTFFILGVNGALIAFIAAIAALLVAIALRPRSDRWLLILLLALAIFINMTGDDLVSRAIMHVKGEISQSMPPNPNSVILPKVGELDSIEGGAGDILADNLRAMHHGEGSLYTRLTMYGDILTRSVASFGLGAGPNGVQASFRAHPGHTRLIDPHNYWLEMLFEYGLVVTVALVALWFALIRRAFQRRRAWPRAVLAIEALIALALASLAPSSFATYFYPTVLYVVAFIALFGLDDDGHLVTRPLHVLHGFSEVAGQGHYTVAGLKDAGVKADMVVWSPNPFGYPYDRSLGIDPHKKALWPWYGVKALIFFLKALVRYDVFHMHFGRSLFLNHELWLLKLMRKTICYEFHGSDLRIKARHVALDPGLADVPLVESDARDRRNARLLALADRIILHDDELLIDIPERYHDKVYIVPLRIDVDAFPEHARPERASVHIVHSPSHPLIKGSALFERAIATLKATHDLTYDAFSHLPQPEAKARYAEADIILDQMHVGTYGVLALEAMLEGVPVVTYIRSDLRATYPAELPVVSLTPETLVAGLARLIDDKTMREAIGHAGRAYVLAYHDMRKVARRLVSIYRGDARPLKGREAFEAVRAITL